jgi:hypothetical protein
MEETRQVAGRPVPSWTAEDLRRALLRRANFEAAGWRVRRTGTGLAHAGVSRRSIRRLGERAAASLARSGRQDVASKLLLDLARGSYHDEQILALEILDRLADLWPAWASDTAAALSRALRHPWVADRLAQVQGRIIARRPLLLSKHALWAVSQNPLRRRVAALALLPRARTGGARGVPVTRAMPILRLLLEDPEPHPLVQWAVARVLAHYARRAPRTIGRLLSDHASSLDPRMIERARRILAPLPSAS